mgnify:FL=1
MTIYLGFYNVPFRMDPSVFHDLLVTLTSIKSALNNVTRNKN